MENDKLIDLIGNKVMVNGDCEAEISAINYKMGITAKSVCGNRTVLCLNREELFEKLYCSTEEKEILYSELFYEVVSMIISGKVENISIDRTTNKWSYKNKVFGYIMNCAFE